MLYITDHLKLLFNQQAITGNNCENLNINYILFDSPVNEYSLIFKIQIDKYYKYKYSWNKMKANMTSVFIYFQGIFLCILPHREDKWQTPEGGNV